MRSLVLAVFFISNFASARQWPQWLHETHLIQAWNAIPELGIGRLNQLAGLELEGMNIENTPLRFDAIYHETRRFLNNQSVKLLSIGTADNPTLVFERYGIRYTLALKPDKSIQAVRGKNPVEVVSPILRSDEDVDLFIRLIQHLTKSVEFQSEPQFSGTHIHLGLETPEAPIVHLFTFLFLAVENEVVYLFNVQNSRTDTYANSLSVDDLNLLAGYKRSSTLEFTRFLRTLETSGGLDRNKSLNWLSFLRHGTVEIRLLNSMTDPVSLLAAVDFYKKLLVAVRTRDERLLQYLKGKKVDEIRLVDVAVAIGAMIASPEVRRHIYQKTFAELNREKTQRASAPKYSQVSSHPISNSGPSTDPNQQHPDTPPRCQSLPSPNSL